MDMGIQKVVMNGKGNFKVSVSDIFQTLRPDLTSNFAGQVLHTKVAFESRQLKVNFRLPFRKQPGKSITPKKNRIGR
jgi:iron complex outermembrane receptor protein